MKVTEFTRAALACRREARDMVKQGWERIDENGGKLWQLHRGYRVTHRIADVRIAADGKTLWVKTDGGEQHRAMIDAALKEGGE